MVRRIVHQLRRSFELARERQIEVARKNKDRDTRGRTPTDFKEGDYLYLWERASSESRLQQDIHKVKGHTGGSLPTKFINPWTGPWKFIRKDGERYCVILHHGKEARH